MLIPVPLAIQGQSGAPGHSGMPGEVGRTGLRGMSGFNGVDGLPGAPGLVGEIGPPGRDAPKSVPIDCEWSEWNDWTDCSVTCGPGQNRRERYVIQYPQNSGKNCNGAPFHIEWCHAASTATGHLLLCDGELEEEALRGEGAAQGGDRVVPTLVQRHVAKHVARPGPVVATMLSPCEPPDPLVTIVPGSTPCAPPLQMTVFYGAVTSKFHKG
jgi:hypothetical protein